MPLPTRLIVSGNRAPHLAGPHHDVDPTVFHTLCYRDFWPAFERRYGANADLVPSKLAMYNEQRSHLGYVLSIIVHKQLLQVLGSLYVHVGKASRG